MENKEQSDQDKIDQQNAATAIRSAIAIEKLDKDAEHRVLDKAEKITENIKDAFTNGGQQ